MSADDVLQVAQLEKECFSHPWSEKSIAGELTNPLSLWLVAVEDAKVVGYAGSQSVMGEADMMNVAVSREYRCRGIGRRLIAELISALKEQGVYCLSLEVRTSNEPAIHLYDSMGFTQVGRRPNYYAAPKEDALILKKEWNVKILAIESSCDETAVAIVEDGRKVLTDCIASQVELHRVYGGVVPEIASRKHIEAIYGLADEALRTAELTRADIDAVAVTYAPGLIGAVLVGVNFGKAAAKALNKPLIPVHHIRGHIAANYLAYPELKPPFLCLVVSGGHTMLVDVKDYTEMEILGGTLDDAAGECFDKVARVLGMPYPGGAALDKAAANGDASQYVLPRSKAGENPYDMSFSGLKTAALNLIHHAEQVGEKLDVNSLCAAFSQAVSDTLVPRAIMALKQTGYKKLAVAGGVAANSKIRSDILTAARELGADVFLPPLSLCGDNAAMIGSQAYYEYRNGNVADMSLNAYATKSILGESI